VVPGSAPQVGVLQFSADSYSVNEGSGSTTISVSRIGGSDGEVSVNYSTSNGTAMAGEDYSFTEGTLTWSEGDSSDKIINLPIIDDGNFEGDEALSISLSNPTGAELATPATATVTIVENEVAQPGTLQFSATDYNVNEGAGSALITVTRTGGANGEVSVNYTTGSGTATEGADYTLTQGSITWLDSDDANKSISVPVGDDTEIEGDEALNITLDNASNGAVLGTPATAALTIVDDDKLITTCGSVEATIVGTELADVLTGTTGVDVIHGLGGNDQISGAAGNDIVCGGDGSDRLSGEKGNDVLHGGEGNDRLNGGANNDQLFGEGGDDRLSGSSGLDGLDGGANLDSCDGGTNTGGTDTAANCEILSNIP
jgi:Ca2+-binding RTX toxin-like protein